jgi:2-C-methyl-D-erythritol 4-phosphate cytidylyltransferase
MPTEAPRCWAVLPAAGIGSRMGGGVPKQYLEVAGASLLEHSLRALLSNAHVLGACVALHPDDHRADTIGLLADPRVIRTDGRAQRSGSVLAALGALADAEPEDWVLVHDAARPCVRAKDIEALIEAVIDAGCGGLLAEAVVDTVKRADSRGRVSETLPREGLWRAQTPQMFRLGELCAALAAAHARGVEVTDEASAMELAGHSVQIVPGSRTNIKVTVPADLPLAALYLEQGPEQALERGDACA